MLFASYCQPAECATEGSLPTGIEATTVLLESRDGGLTWTEISTRVGRWYVRAAVNGEPIAVTFDGPSTQWVMAASNTAIERPENADELGLLNFRGEIAWTARDLPIVVAPSGATRFKLDVGQPLTARIEDVLAPRDGGVAVLWRAQGRRFVTIELGGAPSTVEVTGSVGGLTALLPSPLSVVPSLLVSADVQSRPNLCTTNGTPVHGGYPALLDPSKGYVQFIGGPFISDPCPAGARVILGAWLGPFAVVSGTDSCLSIRAEPEPQATIIDCVRDGALVATLDGTTERAGIPWIAVKTLAGATGWAAEEFLRR